MNGVPQQDRPEGFRRVSGVLSELGHPHAPVYLEVAARTGRRTGTPGQHQQGQQRQPAQKRSKHGGSHEGDVASMVVRRDRPGIVRRITAGAGSWR